MTFWELNKLKVLRLSLLYFAIGGFMALLLSLSISEFAIELLILPFGLMFLMVPLQIIQGVKHFRIIKSYTVDTSEKSFIPLFDNGITLVLNNIDWILFFTMQSLKGRISGLPVKISLFLDGRGGAYLLFTFYPLAKQGGGSDILIDRKFKLGLLAKLKRDIKPDVLKFVNDLKEDGYTSAE